jgi:hypothetical protein
MTVMATAGGARVVVPMLIMIMVMMVMAVAVAVVMVTSGEADPSRGPRLRAGCGPGPCCGAA